MPVAVKICGLNHPAAMTAAVEGGARFVGLVFYPRSPRAVSVDIAAELARQVPAGVRVVGLFVDPDDALIDHTVGRVPLDLIQLHGCESPERVADVRARFNRPVMKAIKIAAASDLITADAYAAVADWLLFDAKPPACDTNALPGGNGRAFDWQLLAGHQWSRPWLLSGGINAANLAQAVAATGATGVDISSGVEDRPGHKDPCLIRDFLAAAARLG